MRKWSKRNIFRVVWFSLAAIFFFWNWLTFQSRDLPANTFENSDKIKVTESSDFITFQSKEDSGRLKLIFFQGGMTDPRAYAPLCRQIAEHGYTTFLFKAAWRLPRYDYERVPTLLDLQQHAFVVAGHSQGELASAQIAFENSGTFKGLILLGTSHPRDIDLSGIDLPVLKIYAERDGLASVGEVMQNKSKLPIQTDWVLIKGGNHSQFGYLGKLLMDDEPEISLAEQQRSTLNSMLQFLSEINEQLAD